MNKAEKSLRWVVNQIPDFKPTTNEEKMLIAIKLYSEAGAEEIKRLEVENAALRERLENAVELPRIIHPNENEWFIQYQLKSGIIDYNIRYSKEAAEARLAELKGEAK